MNTDVIYALMLVIPFLFFGGFLLYDVAVHP